MSTENGQWQPAIILDQKLWLPSHRFDAPDGNGRPDRAAICGKKIFVRESGFTCKIGENHKELEIEPGSFRAICPDWTGSQMAICECQVSLD